MTGLDELSPADLLAAAFDLQAQRDQARAENARWRIAGFGSPDPFCEHDSKSGDEGPVVWLDGAAPVRWRCDGCGQVSYDDAALGDLRRKYANVLAALEDAKRAVDTANRAGETAEDVAVEQAFQRARPGHVKVTIWPRWNSETRLYSLDCSCGWRGPLEGSEQAAQDEFDRHAAGKGPAKPAAKLAERECGNCGEPFPGKHIIETGLIHCPRHTAADSLTRTHPGFIAECDLCAVVAGGETGDKQR